MVRTPSKHRTGKQSVPRKTQKAVDKEKREAKSIGYSKAQKGLFPKN